MGKYDKYLVKDCGSESRTPIFGTAPVYTYGGEGFDEAPCHIEFSFITKDGEFMPGTDKGEGKVITGHYDGYYDGPYPRYTMNCDRIICFYGTNMENMRDLGAHVSFTMGDGIRDEMQTFEFDEPMSVFVPKAVRFGPIKVTGLRSNVVVADILTVPTVAEAAVRPDFTYYSEWHDQERLGKNDAYREQAEKYPRGNW
ncbi:MAG: hypothetical protein LUF35_14390 [Lachnospiraceae bacterium]|nr:hypothetical protein [Lachnospiraceae bacterium]